MISYYIPSDTVRTVMSTLKKKRFLAYLGLAVFCWLLIVYARGQRGTPAITTHVPSPVTELLMMTNTKSAFTINQPGCRIPSISVFGPSVTEFLKPVPPSAPCEFGPPQAKDGRQQNERRFPAVVIDDVTSLRIDHSSLKYYNKTNISCSYNSFRRPTPGDSSPEDDAYIDDVTISSSLTRALNNDGPTTIASETDEFVRVTCTDALSSETSSRGLDSLSRLNFQRQMASSYKYLIEEMAAIEMYGYNKVGDNTFPNLVPLLTGKNVKELHSCWNNSVFDSCPFVWKRFQGYRTVFAEDSPNLAVFNYFQKGFRRQPTDYYLRPFYVEAEKEIGFYMPGNSPVCTGARLGLSVILNYAYKHARAWNERRRFFGFFWSTSFTHDTFNLNAEGDAAVREFLENYYARSGASNDTILIVVSDHGMRWGAFRETYQGRLEERLPLLMFVPPPWFEREYPRAVANLRANQARLTTHFDLHDTLIDLADLANRVKDDAIRKREEALRNDGDGDDDDASSRRSRSLFLPIDVNRKCNESGIPNTYCTCREDSRKLDANDTRSIAAADAILFHLNDLLKDRPECAPLAVDKLEQITVETSTEGGGLFAAPANSTAAVSIFVVTVRLRPGNGLFEGTLKYHVDNTVNAYELVGQVSRINAYGSQSFCVDDTKLKLYCYCRH